MLDMGDQGCRAACLSRLGGIIVISQSHKPCMEAVCPVWDCTLFSRDEKCEKKNSEKIVLLKAMEQWNGALSNFY